jgi:HD-GYP domain-containing protein (c-di-GMP phosphodiesterase class II)
MALHRPYRPGLGVDRALKEVNDHKGVLFDPKVVDACTQVFKDNRFSFQESYGQSFLP